MTRTEIIDSLEEQARDKDLLASGDPDPDSIFTQDAKALRAAAELLRSRQHGWSWGGGRIADDEKADGG